MPSLMYIGGAGCNFAFLKFVVFHITIHQITKEPWHEQKDFYPDAIRGTNR